VSDLQQLLAGTSLSVTETFYLDGAPANVDAVLPTLTLYKPDGTAYTPVPTVLDTWVGPPIRSTGQYRFVMPRQVAPYKLKYHLDGVVGTQPQTLKGWVEWVGASLFTIPAFRQLKVSNDYPFADAATPLFEDSQIVDARAAILDEMQSILGFPPVPRYKLETHDAAGGRGGIVLHEPKPLELLSVTVAGTLQSPGGYYLHPAGILRPFANYLPGPSIPYGYGNVTVEYVHGWERVKGIGSTIAMLWAAAHLNPSGLFSSATTVNLPDGTSYSYVPSEMGRGGFVRHTGDREIDNWFNRHRSKVGASA
jgi:hypothetical protein